MLLFAELLAALAAWHCATEPQPRPTAQREPPARAGGPSSRAVPIVIDDPAKREAAVGELVTVVGTLTRAKIPTVAGVDVEGEAALAGHRVTATGILRRRVVRAEDLEGPIAATRGPGTYYYLIDPKTGQLARTRSP